MNPFQRRRIIFPIVEQNPSSGVVTPSVSGRPVVSLLGRSLVKENQLSSNQVQLTAVRLRGLSPRREMNRMETGRAFPSIIWDRSSLLIESRMRNSGV
jgi:hypothetical protein